MLAGGIVTNVFALGHISPRWADTLIHPIGEKKSSRKSISSILHRPGPIGSSAVLPR